MKRFLDPSPPIITPTRLVSTLTKKRPAELILPRRAIITFDGRDMHRVTGRRPALIVAPWARYRHIYRIQGTGTVLTRCRVGGSNMAALVEELASFGVQEFVVWGYCGAIDPGLAIGDLLLASGALREEGVSYHYLDDEDELVHAPWLDDWESRAVDAGFAIGPVWTCDALYRETHDKVARFLTRGVRAVEMEVASLYAVCRYRGVKGIALLVVSDLLREDGWVPGFSSKAFRDGVERIVSFVMEEAIA